jgi:type IV secretion system protein VirB8
MTAQPYEDAQSWYYEMYESVHARSQRRGLALALSLAVNGLLAVVALRPPPPPEIGIITQDPVTGAVQIAPKLADVQMSRDEALSHWNLVRYLIARETYDPQGLQANFELVYACSSKAVWKPYEAQYDRAQPDNLVDRFQEHTQVGFVFKSISFPEPGRALARFSTVTQSEGRAPQKEHWIATVDFRYGEPPRTPQWRTLNPTGFEVTHYRRDPEVASAESR